MYKTQLRSLNWIWSVPLLEDRHHTVISFHTAVQFPYYCQLAHILNWLLYHRKQIFIFFLRLLIPAINKDYAANCPSNGSTELKISEQHVSANDGFCQSQAGAPCRHKETCLEIELWSNKGNRKYTCASKEITGNTDVQEQGNPSHSTPWSMSLQCNS